MKKLYKSEHSVVGTGIFGGLGEWMEVSPGVLRVGYITLTIFTAVLPGILLYIIAYFLIPKKRAGHE